MLLILDTDKSLYIVSFNVIVIHDLWAKRIDKKGIGDALRLKAYMAVTLYLICIRLYMICYSRFCNDKSPYLFMLLTVRREPGNEDTNIDCGLKKRRLFFIVYCIESIYFIS